MIATKFMIMCGYCCGLKKMSLLGTFAVSLIKNKRFLFCKFFSTVKFINTFPRTKIIKK